MKDCIVREGCGVEFSSRVTSKTAAMRKLAEVRRRKDPHWGLVLTKVNAEKRTAIDAERPWAVFGVTDEEISMLKMAN